MPKILSRVSSKLKIALLICLPLALILTIVVAGRAVAVATVAVTPSADLAATASVQVDVTGADPAALLVVMQCRQGQAGATCASLQATNADANGSLSTQVTVTSMVGGTPCRYVENGRTGAPVARCYITVNDQSTGVQLGTVTLKFTGLTDTTPAASLSVSPASGPVPLTVTADASASTDAEGAIASYGFDWGDGQTTNQATPIASHDYTAVGDYTIFLTVTDPQNENDIVWQTIHATVAANKPPVAKLTVTPATGVAPLIISADPVGTIDPDGSVFSYAYDWGDGSSSSPTSSASPVQHSYATAGSYTVTLTVVDDRGGESQATQPVMVLDKPANISPNAGVPVLSTTFGALPLAVSADASNATDSDGTIASYTFNWGDGTAPTTQTSPIAQHTYAAPKVFKFTVTVKDNAGATATSAPIEVQIYLNAPAFGGQAQLQPADKSKTAVAANTFPEEKGKSGYSIRNYVTVVGDSYQSGEGAGFVGVGRSSSGYFTGDCHRHKSAYVTGPGWPWLNIACSGALYSNVMTTKFTTGNRNELPQIQQLRNNINSLQVIPRIVVFDIGGNDLGFRDVLTNCVADSLYSGPNFLCNKTITSVKNAVSRGDHYNRIRSTIAAIRAETSPKTVIIVMGYPALFPKDGSSVLSGCAIDHAETLRIRQMTRQVNGEAKRAVDDSLVNGSAVYLSNTGIYGGHHLCDGNNGDDWFVPLKATPPEAFHPRAEGWIHEGDLLAGCVHDWKQCLATYTSRTKLTADRSRAGAGTDTLNLEEDPEAELPAPAVPPAPAITISGTNYVFSWPAVSNARWYAISLARSDYVSSLAETAGTSVTSPISLTPPGTCVYLTAFSDDESEITGPCTVTPAPPPPPPVPHAPTASDALIGMCKAQPLTRSVAQYAADADGDIVSYPLISISFSAANNAFSWAGNGNFTMRIPANVPTGSILTIKWRAMDSGNRTSPTATLSIRAASC